MFLAGLQKLSLLDYPGAVACTVFTCGCNLRCAFCHNAGLVLPDRMEGDAPGTQEVLDFLKKRQGILDGVCVTGGEPLLHAELPEFLRQVKELGYRVKLDTNGSFPDRLKELVKEKLVDKVAMDIKNGPSRYAETAGLPELDLRAFETSKDFLLGGTAEYEFRTTVVKGLHTEASLLEAAEWIRGAKVWYLQQFRDSGNLIRSDGLAAFSEEEMHGLLEAVRQRVPTAELRGL
ncbi:MAG: anaerobic ribonucleoside-triphosphate reductase activating protein [Oscillospiraceae bacterium]|nr:anaerobic ribonucleoside-triphosphate reductase activating protein [Oscillospiraceae bacterium]